MKLSDYHQTFNASNVLAAACVLLGSVCVMNAVTGSERGDADVESGGAVRSVPAQHYGARVYLTNEPDNGDVEAGRTVVVEAPARYVEEPVVERAPAPMIRPRVAAPLQPAVVHVDESNFDAEVGSYKGPVLIDFYSKLCGPCQRTSPIVDGLAEEFRGRVKVVKIESERAPALLQRFAVNGLPCLVMQNGGNTVNRHVGEPSPDLLRGWMRGAK